MQVETLGLPAVQILLVAVIFLSLLVEIKTGGMGVGALTGIVAAGVFFGSQFVSGLVSFFEIAVFLGGILFVVIEMLTPGVGFFAAIGIVLILYSFILALGGDVSAVYFLFLSLLIAIFAFALLVKRLPSSKLWDRVVLNDRSTSGKGYVSASDYTDLLHQEGIVLTELRPAGTALIGEVKADVVSEGRYVEKGAKVRVISVGGGRIVVREIQ